MSVETVKIKGKKMTEQQIPKFLGVIIEHQAEFKEWSTNDAQWAIQNAREAIALWTQAIANRTAGQVVVKVDWSLSLEDAIKAGGYGSQCIAIGAKLPPSSSSGIQWVEVGLNKRESITTNQEWLDYLKGLDESFIHPLVLLAIGAKFSNMKRQAPMFTIWIDDGQLWYLYLNQDTKGWRVVMGRYLGSGWGGHCLAASTRK
ncbi:MAG: hypothetical protein WCV73_01445 [Patescibacteria group bacterium]